MKHTLLSLIAVAVFTLTGLAQQTITDGRLSVTYSYQFYRDSLNCKGEARYNYTGKVINSTGADVVKKYRGFPTWQLSMQYPNTTALPTFQFFPSHYTPFDDYRVVNDTLYWIFTPTLFICGLDTVFIPADTLAQYWPNPCVYDTLLNYMYYDTSGTCSGFYDNPPVNGLNVEIRDTVYNGNVVTPAYAAGSAGASLYYIQKTFRNPGCGVYLPQILQFLYPNSDPGCITPYFWFDSLPNNRHTLTHGFKAERKLDVSVWLGTCGIIRPNVPFLMFPEVFNMGYKAVSGQVYLVLDPRVNYNSLLSSNPPAGISGDTLMWNFSNLSNATNGGWWNAFQTFLHLTPDSLLNVGDTLCFEIFTGHVPDDINMANNYLQVCYPVVNSFDPNVKEVQPAGEGPLGNIPVSTTELTYTVHFQNTGNAPAINITVLDTLDSNIDPQSFNLLGSTHKLDPEWAANGVFRARFTNINLPDSASNEPKSHGSFSYKVKLKAGLTAGAQIKNSAAIYFDNNAPIITNTTVNTLHEFVIGVQDVSAVAGINIYPNPAGNRVTVVTAETLANGSIKVLNVNGQLVQQQTNLYGNTFMFDVATLPSGVYFIQVTTSAGLQQVKLIKEY